ncbi:MAG: PEP-CTERM sorting domain-containing protein [Gemmataceae bacterium]
MRIVAALACALMLSPVVFGQGYLGTVGYNDLQLRLGVANTPNGQGVTVAQVEAPDGSGFYSANPNQMGRTNFTMTFNGTSVSPLGFSSHATFVAQNFWSANSMGSGISQIDAWNANNWIDTVLDGNGTGIPVSSYLPKVSNHSYIAELNSTFTQADAEAYLMKSDYLVDVTKHIMVVAGGNNGATSPSALFGSGYNSIAVGRADNGGGGGFTSIAVAGRVKPDLVTPETSVSGATPIAASAAAVLVQVAGNTPHASDPQTIKAIMMAGTTKSYFDTAVGGPWSNTSTRPLDSRFGAGMLNINNSHMILTAGRQTASTSSTVAKTGWDYNTIDTTQSISQKRYFFDVPNGESIISFSAALTWNRQFTVGDPTQFTLAHLNLHLYAADANFNLVGSPIAESLSTVDNVQYLWLTSGMSTGRYAMLIDTTDAAISDYGLAWQFISVPEPTTVGGLSLVILLVVRRIRKRNRPAQPASV